MPVRPNHIAPPSLWPLWMMVVLGSLPEIILCAADAGLIGSPIWRIQAYSLGAFWNGLLQDWAPNYPMQPVLMYVSYAFLHVGPTHMLTNMIGLFWLGRSLQNCFGTRFLLWLYFLAILGGALCFGVLSTSPRPMVGASGGLYGLVVVWVLTQIRPSYLWRLAACAILLLANLIPAGDAAWQTHLGGALTGIAFYLHLRKTGYNASSTQSH